MLKIKTSTATVSEDFVAVEESTGLTAISSRHVVGILSIAIFSVLLALPYGELVPASSSPLLSIFSQQKKLDETSSDKYIATEDADALEDMEIAQTAGSEENYDDTDVTARILANTSDENAEDYLETSNDTKAKELYAHEGPSQVKISENEDKQIKSDANSPTSVLRQRFESIAANKKELSDPKGEHSKESSLLSKDNTLDKSKENNLNVLGKIQSLLKEGTINPEQSIIENILKSNKTPIIAANEQKVKENAPLRPKGSWYSQTVHKGDTLSEIFNYLNLPYATLKRISAVAAKKDLNLSQGQKIHFLIDDKNIVLELVKSIGKGNQVRFSRMTADENFKVFYEKENAHLSENTLLASIPKAQDMPLAQEAQIRREKEKARREEEARLIAAQEAQIEKQLQEGLKTRPRLVLGMMKKNENFDKAARRSGLTRTEISTIKNSFAGKVNFKRLKSGDSFRILTDGIGSKANIIAIEINSSRSGKVVMYRNPINKNFYEEGGYRPTAGAFKRFPIAGRIKVNSPFNMTRMHPIRKRIVPHKGVDFKVSIGTPVYAPADGKVKFAGFMRGGGYVVILDHKGGYSTVYMHLSKFDVKKGQEVAMGQVIAKSGNTGYSTGPHLHYELHVNGRPVDPLKADLPSGNAAKANQMRKQFESAVANLKTDLYKNSLAQKN